MSPELPGLKVLKALGQQTLIKEAGRPPELHHIAETGYRVFGAAELVGEHFLDETSLICCISSHPRCNLATHSDAEGERAMSWFRREQPEAPDTMRVRVFIDHSDFAHEWQKEHSRISGVTTRSGSASGSSATDNSESGNFGDGSAEARVSDEAAQSQDVRWERLPDTIMKYLDTLDYIGDIEKEMRGIDVYATVTKPRNGNQHDRGGKKDGGKDDNDSTTDDDKTDFERWLDEELDPIPGFQVHIFSTTSEAKKRRCNSCKKTFGKSKNVKGLNTQIACDMLSHAVRDSYDIGVIMMSDAELVPSIICVQEIFDKQIIHIGSRSGGQALRSAAWAHLIFENLVPDLMSEYYATER